MNGITPEFGPNGAVMNSETMSGELQARYATEDTKWSRRQAALGVLSLVFFGAVTWQKSLDLGAPLWASLSTLMVCLAISCVAIYSTPNTKARRHRWVESYGLAALLTGTGLIPIESASKWLYLCLAALWLPPLFVSLLRITRRPL